MSYAYFGDLEEYNSKFEPRSAVSPSTESTPVGSPPTESISAGPPALVEDTVYESDGFYDKVGKYMISTLCLGVSPCKHTVIDVATGEKMYLNAVAIYDRLHSHGLNHPHFDIYRDYTKIEL